MPDNNTQDPTVYTEAHPADDTPEGIGQTYATDGVTRVIRALNPATLVLDLNPTINASLEKGVAEYALPSTGWLAGTIGQFAADAVPFVNTDSSYGSGASDTSWGARSEAFVLRNTTSEEARLGRTLANPAARDVYIRINPNSPALRNADLFSNANDMEYDIHWYNRAWASGQITANGIQDLWNSAEIFDPSGTDDPTTRETDERWRPMTSAEKVAFGIGTLLGPENIASFGVARLATAGKQGMNLAKFMDGFNLADTAISGSSIVTGVAASVENPVRIRDYLNFLNRDGVLDSDPMFFASEYTAGVGLLQYKTNVAMNSELEREFHDNQGDISKMGIRSIAIDGEFSSNPNDRTNLLLSRAGDVLAEVVEMAQGRVSSEAFGVYEGGVQSQILSEWQDFDNKFKHIAQGIYESENPQQALRDLSRTDLIRLQIGLRARSGNIGLFGDTSEALAETNTALNEYVQQYGASFAFQNNFGSNFQIVYGLGSDSVPATVGQTYELTAAALVALAGANPAHIADLDVLGSQKHGVSYARLVQGYTERASTITGQEVGQLFRLFADPEFLNGGSEQIEKLQDRLAVDRRLVDGQDPSEVGLAEPEVRGVYDGVTSSNIATVFGDGHFYIMGRIGDMSADSVEARAGKALFDRAAIDTIERLATGELSIQNMTQNQIVQAQIFLAVNTAQIPDKFGTYNETYGDSSILDNVANLPNQCRRFLLAVGENREYERMPNISDEAYMRGVAHYIIKPDMDRAIAATGARAEAISPMRSAYTSAAYNLETSGGSTVPRPFQPQPVLGLDA